MEPTRECSFGSTTSVRLTPSAPGGHCSASAVPISKTRMVHAATVLRMIPFEPLGGANALHPLGLCARAASGHAAAEQCDELATLHSITSSASVSRLSEMLTPSALAVLRLITSSNLVGCRTGRSAGLAPLRMLAV